MVPQSSCFWRREAFERVGALREDLHVIFDYEYWARAALAGCQFARIDEVLSLFRIHEQQKTSRLHRRWLEEKQQLFLEEQQNPDFPFADAYFRRKRSNLLGFAAEVDELEGNYGRAALSRLHALFALGYRCRPADVLWTAKSLTKLLINRFRSASERP
jgi:hypothetical protein